MNGIRSLAVATMGCLVAAAAPRSAEACDGACCQYPPSSFRVVGDIRAGFVVTATIASCDDGEEKHPLPQWEDTRVRRISEKSVVMVLGAQRRPYAYAEPLPFADAYSPEELLYYWSRAPKHGALLQRSETEPAKLEPVALRAREVRGVQVVLTQAGDVLYAATRVEPGCVAMSEAKVKATYTTAAHDYVLVVSHTRTLSANDPYSQDELSVVAKPDRLDLVVVDAISSESNEARALLDAALTRLQKAGLRSVKVKKATGKHTETTLFARSAETDYPAQLFAGMGGPPAPASGWEYVWPGVILLTNALLGEPRDAVHTPQFRLADLDWDEPAHLVLVVADDLPAVLERIRADIRECQQQE